MTMSKFNMVSEISCHLLRGQPIRVEMVPASVPGSNAQKFGAIEVNRNGIFDYRLDPKGRCVTSNDDSCAFDLALIFCALVPQDLLEDKLRDMRSAGSDNRQASYEALFGS